jgi:ABC-2 type transport system permease protein
VSLLHCFRAFWGIVGREIERFVHQKERFISALVRPLLWLLVFAAGFRASLGLAIQPPYETYVLYEVYVTPGLLGMIQLFNGMQSSLSMVYDREMGSMKMLLVSPLPRPFLLFAKLCGGVVVSLMQCAVFLGVAWFFEVQTTPAGYLYVVPALCLSGFMLGALGLFLSSVVRQLENFSGVMNFVIFPMFFLSTALYPLWKLKESSTWLPMVAAYNPFSQAVEMVRFALYGQFNSEACGYTLLAACLFMLAAMMGYDPSRGTMQHKGAGRT